MSKISEHIRECACGPSPFSSDGMPRTVNWVGHGNQWKVLDHLMAPDRFYQANEEQQRTFLLLVAEVLE